jgi:hypothetical protein
MPLPTFSNTIQTTQHAVEMLNNAVADCNSIRNRVDEAVQRLVGQGMVSLSGQAYGKAVARWITDFDVITSNLGAMARQLSSTAVKIQKNEDNLSLMPTQITNLLSQ